MTKTIHQEIDLQLLEEHIASLIPDKLFEEFRASIRQAIARRNLGGSALTQMQGKAIESWLSDQIDILEIVVGFHLCALEDYVKGVEHEDLSLRLTGK